MQGPKLHVSKALPELADGVGSKLVLLVFSALASMPNLIPPRQCPVTLQMNQYFFGSVSLTLSSPLSYLANTPLLVSHVLYVDSVTSNTLCCPLLYVNSTKIVSAH